MPMELQGTGQTFFRAAARVAGENAALTWLVSMPTQSQVLWIAAVYEAGGDWRDYFKCGDGGPYDAGLVAADILDMDDGAVAAALLFGTLADPGEVSRPEFFAAFAQTIADAVTACGRNV